MLPGPPALNFLGAWHLSARFNRQHPDLAAELLDHMDALFEADDGPAAHRLADVINDFLVSAAEDGSGDTPT